MRIVTNFFGGCPECGNADGYANAGRTHIFFCKKHRTRWIAGTNLFSSWREESEELQRWQYAEIGLATFREVQPLREGTPIFAQGSLYDAVINETVQFGEQIISNALKKIRNATTSELEEAQQGIVKAYDHADQNVAHCVMANLLYRAIETELQTRQPGPTCRGDTAALSRFIADLDRLIDGSADASPLFKRLRE